MPIVVSYPESVAARLEHASLEQLTAWGERVLEARSLDALFAE